MTALCWDAWFAELNRLMVEHLGRTADSMFGSTSFHFQGLVACYSRGDSPDEVFERVRKNCRGEIDE